MKIDWAGLMFLGGYITTPAAAASVLGTDTNKADRPPPLDASSASPSAVTRELCVKVDDDSGYEPQVKLLQRKSA